MVNWGSSIMRKMSRTVVRAPLWLSAAAVVAMGSWSGALAKPPEVAQRIEAPAPLGAAEGKLLFVPLFDAELWTEGRSSFDWNAPFALSLTYRQSFSSGMILWATISEIQRISGKSESQIAGLEAKLSACLPAVNQGDRITGFSRGSDRVDFTLNGTPICSVSHPDLTRLFFSIWLDPRARDPEGAARLRGAS